MWDAWAERDFACVSVYLSRRHVYFALAVSSLNTL